MLERSDGSFASHDREIVKELVQRLPSFEIIKQNLEWDSRAWENRSTPKDFRIARDDVVR